MLATTPGPAVRQAGTGIVMAYLGFLLYLTTLTPHDARLALKKVHTKCRHTARTTTDPHTGIQPGAGCTASRTQLCNRLCPIAAWRSTLGRLVVGVRHLRSWPRPRLALQGPGHPFTR